MRLYTRKRAAIAGVVGAFAIGAGAFAYFTADGTGTGSASVGDSAAATINQIGTVGPLYPTTSDDVVITVTNNGAGSQRVELVSLDSVTTDLAHAGCDLSVFTMPDIDVSETLAAGATSGQYTGTLTMADNGLDQNDCRLAPLTLHFTSN